MSKIRYCIAAFATVRSRETDPMSGIMRDLQLENSTRRPPYSHQLDKNTNNALRGPRPWTGGKNNTYTNSLAKLWNINLPLVNYELQIRWWPTIYGIQTTSSDEWPWTKRSGNLPSSVLLEAIGTRPSTRCTFGYPTRPGHSPNASGVYNSTQPFSVTPRAQCKTSLSELAHETVRGPTTDAEIHETFMPNSSTNSSIYPAVHSIHFRDRLTGFGL